MNNRKKNDEREERGKNENENIERSEIRPPNASIIPYLTTLTTIINSTFTLLTNNSIFNPTQISL